MDNVTTTAPNNKVRKGSLINFYGTQHTVNSVGSAKNDDIMDTVNVTVAVIDGKETTTDLWWRDCAGCAVIKF